MVGKNKKVHSDISHKMNRIIRISKISKIFNVVSKEELLEKVFEVIWFEIVQNGQIMNLLESFKPNDTKLFQ